MDKISSIKTVNPTTGETVKVFEEMTEAQIEQIISNADKTFVLWKNTPFAKRAELFKKLALLMKSKKEELARLCALEMGKRLKEGISEIEVCADILDYYAENGEQFLSDKPLNVPFGKAYISYEPLGVILCIEPWNFPFYQLIRAVASTIMAGNTVVVKHASNVPQCGAMMESLFLEADFPVGVYNNITHGALIYKQKKLLIIN